MGLSGERFTQGGARAWTRSVIRLIVKRCGTILRDLERYTLVPVDSFKVRGEWDRWAVLNAFQPITDVAWSTRQVLAKRRL